MAYPGFEESIPAYSDRIPEWDVSHLLDPHASMVEAVPTGSDRIPEWDVSHLLSPSPIPPMVGGGLADHSIVRQAPRRALSHAELVDALRTALNAANIVESHRSGSILGPKHGGYADIMHSALQDIAPSARAMLLREAYLAATKQSLAAFSTRGAPGYVDFDKIAAMGDMPLMPRDERTTGAPSPPLSYGLGITAGGGTFPTGLGR